MSQKVQKQKTAPAKTEAPVEQTPQTDSKEDLKAEMDEILDEIDSVLEENAETFVRNYIQKGANKSLPTGGQPCYTEAWTKYAPPATNTFLSQSSMPTALSRMV